MFGIPNIKCGGWDSNPRTPMGRGILSKDLLSIAY